jgi:hypothetical protein
MLEFDIEARDLALEGDRAFEYEAISNRSASETDNFEGCDPAVPAPS